MRPAAAYDVNQFFDAVENGDSHLVGTLLKADPSLVNLTDTRMTEPLGYSSKMRIKKEGRPDPPLRPRKSASLNSALHIAVDNRHFEVAQILLQRGANVNAAGDSGKTPLQTAVDWLNGPVSFELVALRIESGAEANVSTRGGFTALHEAIYAMQDTPPPPKEVVEILLRSGADATARTRSGETALESLVKLPKCAERVPIAIMLIQEENRRGRSTEAPLLCLAASRDEREVVRFLIEAGMDVNRADETGSPLHHAARQGFSENVNLLLAAGADPWTLDPAGRTAVECIPQKLLDALSVLEEHVQRRGL